MEDTVVMDAESVKPWLAPVREVDRRLFIACSNMDAEAVRSAIRAGADVNALNEFCSAFPVNEVTVQAIRERESQAGIGPQVAQVMEILLENGADPNGIPGEIPPLMFFSCEDFQISSMLIDKGADVNRIYGNQTVLDHVFSVLTEIGEDSPESMRRGIGRTYDLLTQHGAGTYESIMRLNQTIPEWKKLIAYNDTGLLRERLSHRLEPFSSEEKYELLTESIQQMSLDSLQYFIEECDFPAGGEPNPMPLLHIAAECGWLEGVQYLCYNCFIDPETKDFSGCTPLFTAASENAFPVVKYLVEECLCDPNARNNAGAVPLMFAVVSADQDNSILHYLVETCHVEINASDDHGRTALTCAEANGQHETVKYLIAHGAVSKADAD